MAFLYEEDRGLTATKDPYPHLGPGVYNVQNDREPRHAYAPFMSTKKRAEKPQQPMPGPGTYEVSKNIGESGVQAYMNKSTIIVKVRGNGSSSFKSNEDRFKVKRSEIPGPGTYSQEKKPDTVQETGYHTSILENMRQLNHQRKINSIPEPKGQVGTQCQDIESLAQYQEQLKLKERQQIVGPTTYNVMPKQEYRGVSWDRDARPRFNEDKRVQQVGPGHYEVKNTEPRHKKNASPAFVSECVRSYFDKLTYNTNSELKAELRKRTGEKYSEMPGPGQYVEHRQAINVQSKSPEFQFFGSSMERFRQISSMDQIGPGAYNVNHSFDAINKKKNFVNRTFMSTTVRDDVVNVIQQPGPGDYDIDAVQSLQRAVIKKYSQGYKGNFGMKGSRFDNVKQLTNAGPGSYNTTKLPSNSQTRVASSSFKSGTKRNDSSHMEAPPIGSYKLDQCDISTKIQKQTKFLKNLKKIDVLRPAFDSGQERFKEQLSEEAVPMPHQDKIRSRSHTSEHHNPGQMVSAPFKSQVSRLGYLAKKHTPGVGQYVVQDNWKVNSFNQHYNKILEEN